MEEDQGFVAHCSSTDICRTCCALREELIATGLELQMRRLACSERPGTPGTHHVVVAVGNQHTVLIWSDGSAVAAGSNKVSQLNVADLPADFARGSTLRTSSATGSV